MAAATPSRGASYGPKAALRSASITHTVSRDRGRPLGGIAVRNCAIRLFVAAAILVAVPVVGSQAASRQGGPATSAAQKATRATFAGTWYGHTRGLTISRKGRAKESIDDGCCTHVIDLRFRLSHIRGTSSHASARARVTAVHVRDHRYFSKSNPPPHIGERRRLRLAHGVIKEPFTKTNYCTLKADLKGYCGA
jgi:hypothetical protein